MEIQLSFLKGKLQGAIDRCNAEENLCIELTKEVNKIENLVKEKKKKTWKDDIEAIGEASEEISKDMQKNKWAQNDHGKISKNSPNESTVTYEKTEIQSNVQQAQNDLKKASTSSPNESTVTSEKIDLEYYKYDNDENIKLSLMGRRVDNREDAFRMYKAHSRAIGFNIRKNTDYIRERKKKEKEIANSEFIDEEKQSSKKRKERSVNETRTGCRANIRFKIIESGEYCVIQHNIKHNHELVNPSERHHLNSKRSVKEEIGMVIEKMIESGIKPMDCYEYLKREIGSKESLGHTKRDLLNYVTRYKSSIIEGGDMQSVLDTLQQRAESDPSLFYRLKFGEKDYIVSYFWRD
ncbi:protein FAR1-RELATED SEQUENCE 5-like [Chenopodium quinoa]|uniref:protein FAR1-RELATED SEQUENCE 5-like n=1 Tax=Chenopodium quinoa TaxID=63459 RepID=UPI000B78B216|nr:protein FAR1-RELATED SEQUENCE 5-like [Chenopodium quinoa]